MKEGKNMGREFIYNGTTFELDNSLPRYYEHVFLFSQKNKEIQECVLNLVNRQETVNNIISSVDKYLNDAAIETVHIIESSDVYDVSVTDLKDFNPGNLTLLKVYTKCYQEISKIQNRNSSIAEAELSNAAEEANSMVTGLDFGIISSDIISLMVYDSMQSSAVKKQTDEAQRYYDSISSSILNLTDTNTRRQINTYIKDVFTDELFGAVNEFISYLIATIVQIEKLSLNNVNESKAKKILANFDISTNKSKIIEKALIECPFYEDIYIKAIENDFFNETMCEIISFINPMHDKIYIRVINYIRSELNKYYANVNINNRPSLFYATNRKYYDALQLLVDEDMYKKLYTEFVTISWDKTKDNVRRFVDFLYKNDANEITKYMLDELKIKTSDSCWIDKLNAKVSEVIDESIIEEYTEILGSVVEDELCAICRAAQNQKVNDLIESITSRISVCANDVSNKIAENKAKELEDVNRKYDRLINDAKYSFSSGLIKYLIIAPIILFLIFACIAASPETVEVDWSGVFGFAFFLDAIPLGVYCLFIMPGAIENSNNRQNALISEKNKQLDAIKKKYK